MPGIVVVGSLSMDLIVRTPRLPAPGETILGATFSTAPGGRGAIQAVAAARLGTPVKMVGRTGTNDFGQALRASLHAVGVETQFVVQDPGTATGVALISVDDRGQTASIFAPGANARVARADIDAAANVLRQAGVLVVQLEIPLETVTYALQRARQWNVLTLLNPAPAQPLSREILQLADVVVPNETEAGQLTGIPVTDVESAQNAASALRQMGARQILITLGAQGVFWMNEEAKSEHLPAFPVQAVDPTAAGEAFVGALASALAREKDWVTALREARGAGALATTKPGGQSALPTRAELDEFLGQTV
jgi:ribokinase